jgi:hypothetical protein
MEKRHHRGCLTRALNPTNPSNRMWGTKEATGLSRPALLPRIRPDRGYLRVSLA